MIREKFNRDKAIEIILYLSIQLENRSAGDIYRLMYFADKTSLERYARTTCGDIYIATKFGPTPFETEKWFRESKETHDITGKDIIKPTRPPDVDLLSESDVDTLDLVVRTWGLQPSWRIRELAQDEVWRDVRKTGRPKYEMSLDKIITLLDVGKDLYTFLSGK